ncbi:glycosyltransferase family 2 protein [Streptomyces sp. NBC_01381]|uniref:glycosyltransferase family 2 protein n=1 Tax=Streptomyces sp. NBC_01381 TaxID=2903845 RepID=UPI002258372B|nr:glycosyltransferase family 2 protein [Streptomyces sp. NBC_01381]MCX4666484.1 glycosyltransferase family 2 protein [Streptomyces sp. NBC_01381]
MNAPSQPRVVTITVGTNERPWLHNCFSSLTASNTTGLHLDVVYVDNASTDGSLNDVRRFPEVEAIQSRTNLGFAAANNLAMRRALNAGADYIFLVNPDTRTPTTLIRDLVDFMDANPQYGIVGPLQYTYSDASEHLHEHNDWTRLALRCGEQHGLAADWQGLPSPAGPEEGRAPNTLEHAYVQGAALFVRADALRKTGLFDEVFHTYYEETDLCRRVRWAGWRVALLLDLGIQHKGGGGAGNGKYRRTHMRRNRYYYLATDVDWTFRNTLRLAGRWLRKDFRGKSVGGQTTPLRGTYETVLAIAWLCRHLPQIVERRQRHRRLAHQRTAPDATNPAPSVKALGGTR